MFIVPKPFPREFREDVIRVARSREPGQSLKQIATDFGIAESCLRNWLRQEQLDRGEREDGVTTEERDELRKLRRQVRELEQEREILKRAVTFFARETDRR